MENFIYWLSKYSTVLDKYSTALDLVQIIVSLATALAAFVLVYVTWILARVTKRSPFVVCTMESNTNNKHFLTMIIRNTGNATAFDVEAKIEAYQETPTGEGISNFGISILTPDKGFIPSMAVRKWKLPVKFDVNVSWASKPNGWKKRQRYTLDYTDNLRSGWHEAGLDQLVELIAEFHPNKL